MFNKFEIAEILREIGEIIELTNDQPKKSIAYKRAAKTISNVPDLKKVVEENALESLPGIGKEISKMIAILYRQGKLNYYEELKKKIPEKTRKLLKIPSLGARRLRILIEYFNVSDLDELENALENDALQKIKLFSPSILKKIKTNIQRLKSEGFCILYRQAEQLGEAIISKLHDCAFIKRVEVAGEVRRKCEVVYHLEFVALCDQPVFCIDAFLSSFWISEVLQRDENHVSVLLKSGIKASLYVVNEEKFVLEFWKRTGNEEHVKKVELLNTEDHSFKNEHQIYKSASLQYIVPELRENYGEINAAKTKCLPQLIEEKDLKGAFHCHTTFSDGSNSLEEMVQTAFELGWQYIGISDHSKSSYQANGMDEERLLKQIEEIKMLNEEYKKRKFRIFSGIECDILKDGNLDFSDDILKQLDFVIVSVHRYFGMENELMTARIIKAIENPYTTIVGHLTGRLLRIRDPYQVDVNKVIDACIANDKVMELNAYPSRLDMDWRYWIKAKEKGLKCCINPDAHSIYDLQLCKYGVLMARKGWLEPHDVINTLTTKQMENFLAS